jgi:hypothetical protein
VRENPGRYDNLEALPAFQTASKLL